MDKTTNQIHPDNSIQHPLNPLTPEELNLVVDITKQECHLDERVLFETVCLLNLYTDDFFFFFSLLRKITFLL